MTRCLDWTKLSNLLKRCAIKVISKRVKTSNLDYNIFEGKKLLNFKNTLEQLIKSIAIGRGKQFRKRS